jgi:hypothetical protein
MQTRSGVYHDTAPQLSVMGPTSCARVVNTGTSEQLAAGSTMSHDFDFESLVQHTGWYCAVSVGLAIHGFAVGLILGWLWCWVA